MWHVDYVSYLQELFGKTEFPASPSVVVDLCSTVAQDTVPKKISYLYSQMENIVATFHQRQWILLPLLFIENDGMRFTYD